MSQSAIIAFENSNGTFDLYWSHNGADGFYLKPYLEEVAAGDRARTLPDVEPKLPDGAEDPGFTVAETLKQTIVPEPVRRQVPEHKVGENIDFLAYEGLYLVTDRGVELYYPMWTYPGLFIALRNMFDIEVYGRDQFEPRPESGFDDITPVATFSDEDYSLDRFKDVRYRRFIELHHLGIFQTIAGTVNDATDTSDLQSASLEQEEIVNIIPKTTENIFEPHRVGHGVLINFHWNDGNVSQRLDSLINRSASLRVEISLRLLEESDGAPTRVQYKNFERELVEQAYRHFGMMIYPQPIQPFTSLIQDISEIYAPNKAPYGETYRVIDTDAETALLKPTEQYGKTGVTNPSDLSSDDVKVVDLEATAEDFVGVVKHVEKGDIVIADIDGSSTLFKIQSIQLLQKIPLVMTDTETVPSFVQQLYDQEVESDGGGDKLPSVRTHLSSEFETISESEIDIGEVQVTHDPEDEMWTGLEFGEISEQIYGRFQFTADQPHEVLLCNPTTESFWFGFFLSTAMTGFARHWRREFGCEYESETLSSDEI